MTYRTYSIYPVRVNAVAAGLSTDTITYSIYPNPYITINGNRWTKHYYIGSERVASRTGTISGGFNGLHDMDSDVAGSTLQIPVNYDSMCATEEDSIASIYERFGVPYEVQHANSRGQVAHMYFPITRTDSEDNTAETSGEGSQRSHPNTLGEGPVYFYHRDHLGSTMSVTDSLSNTIQQVEYTPWGEVFVEQRSGNSDFSTPYLFNGKELDEESGLYYYGARYYDPKLSVWYSIDPLSNYNPYRNDNHLDGKHNGGVFYQGNLNPYIYCYQNPIKFLDPDGRQVYACFNKTTGRLAIFPDLSKFKNGLPFKFVDAFTYSQLSKTVHSRYNYGIIVEGIFTGGHSENGVIKYQTNFRELPISKGMYSILENKGNTDPSHSTFFVLDPVDNWPYDKIDDRKGEINADGEKRKGYNLHPGTVSHGCVTMDLNYPLENGTREEEWEIIHNAITNTKTEEVPDNRGFHRYYPGKQIKYGTLQVID